MADHEKFKRHRALEILFHEKKQEFFEVHKRLPNEEEEVELIDAIADQDLDLYLESKLLLGDEI